MKAMELQELGVEGTLGRGNTRKVKAQLKQQVVSFLSLESYD
ncbi:hypothetical protein A2U01_0111433, partial [Trifolium medium]|nr:hypothetical protein [Trifolium medium]